MEDVRPMSPRQPTAEGRRPLLGQHGTLTWLGTQEPAALSPAAARGALGPLNEAPPAVPVAPLEAEGLEEMPHGGASGKPSARTGLPTWHARQPPEGAAEASVAPAGHGTGSREGPGGMALSRAQSWAGVKDDSHGQGPVPMVAAIGPLGLFSEASPVRGPDAVQAVRMRRTDASQAPAACEAQGFSRSSFEGDRLESAVSQRQGTPGFWDQNPEAASLRPPDASSRVRQRREKGAKLGGTEQAPGLHLQNASAAGFGESLEGRQRVHEGARANRRHTLRKQISEADLALHRDATWQQDYCTAGVSTPLSERSKSSAEAVVLAVSSPSERTPNCMQRETCTMGPDRSGLGPDDLGDYLPGLVEAGRGGGRDGRRPVAAALGKDTEAAQLRGAAGVAVPFAGMVQAAGAAVPLLDRAQAVGVAVPFADMVLAEGGDADAGVGSSQSTRSRASDSGGLKSPIEISLQHKSVLKGDCLMPPVQQRTPVHGERSLKSVSFPRTVGRQQQPEGDAHQQELSPEDEDATEPPGQRRRTRGSGTWAASTRQGVHGAHRKTLEASSASVRLKGGMLFCVKRAPVRPRKGVVRSVGPAVTAQLSLRRTDTSSLAGRRLSGTESRSDDVSTDPWSTARCPEGDEGGSRGHNDTSTVGGGGPAESARAEASSHEPRRNGIVVEGSLPVAVNVEAGMGSGKLVESVHTESEMLAEQGEGQSPGLAVGHEGEREVGRSTGDPSLGSTPRPPHALGEDSGAWGRPDGGSGKAREFETEGPGSATGKEGLESLVGGLKVNMKALKKQNEIRQAQREERTATEKKDPIEAGLRQLDITNARQLIVIVWSFLLAAGVLGSSALVGALVSPIGRKFGPRFSLHVALVMAGLAFFVSLALCCLWAMYRFSERVEVRKKELLKELEVARACEDELRMAKKEFLGSLSHEIRTPLNGIIGMLQFLAEEGGLGAEEQEAVDIALVSCWSLVDWVANFVYAELGIPTSTGPKASGAHTGEPGPEFHPGSTGRGGAPSAHHAPRLKGIQVPRTMQGLRLQLNPLSSPHEPEAPAVGEGSRPRGVPAADQKTRAQQLADAQTPLVPGPPSRAQRKCPTPRHRTVLQVAHPTAGIKDSKRRVPLKWGPPALAHESPSNAHWSSMLPSHLLSILPLGSATAGLSAHGAPHQFLSLRLRGAQGQVPGLQVGCIASGLGGALAGTLRRRHSEMPQLLSQLRHYLPVPVLSEAGPWTPAPKSELESVGESEAGSVRAAGREQPEEGRPVAAVAECKPEDASGCSRDASGRPSAQSHTAHTPAHISRAASEPILHGLPTIAEDLRIAMGPGACSVWEQAEGRLAQAGMGAADRGEHADMDAGPLRCRTGVAPVLHGGVAAVQATVVRGPSSPGIHAASANPLQMHGDPAHRHVPDGEPFKGPVSPSKLGRVGAQGGAQGRDEEEARKHQGQGLGQGERSWEQGSVGHEGKTAEKEEGGGGGVRGQVDEAELLARLRGRRVLVVDDNAVNRKVLGAMLRPYGVEPVQAADGKQALERMHPFDAHGFACVFMDLQMPVMDGYQATAAIRDKEAKQALGAWGGTQPTEGVQSEQGTQLTQGMQAEQRMQADHGVQAEQGTQPTQGMQTEQRVQAEQGMGEEQGMQAGQGVPARARVPIFAVTADLVTGARDKCLGVGMDGFMTKPLSKPQLQSALLQVAQALGGPG